jgi:hypothetical protein
MKSSDLQVESHFRALGAAEGHRLTELAAELPIGALQQRGGAQPLRSQASNGVEHEGLLKITF